MNTLYYPVVPQMVVDAASDRVYDYYLNQGATDKEDVDHC